MAAQRGEIYFLKLHRDENADLRPVMVLSINAINRLPLVVTIVVGTKGEKITRDYLATVRVIPEESGLLHEVVFLGYQVRSLQRDRFVGEPAGHVPEEKLKKIEEAVRYCIGL